MFLLRTNSESFKILNITDPQLCDCEWFNPEMEEPQRILEFTVKELVERIKPDLITVSGDISRGDQTAAYKAFFDFMDAFKIPWAPIWGNHDNQYGEERMREIASALYSYKYCIYEEGPKELGNGNYVIGVEINGKPASAVIMMDTHDRFPYTESDGSEVLKWARLTAEQHAWYREQVENLRDVGYNDTMLITHIPIYAYKEASLAAFKEGIDLKAVTIEASDLGEYWNDDYKDSFGVQHENISCYPEDDGFFDLVKGLASTKHILAGHDHINNTVINYQGIKLIFALKTGMGCYWEPKLNGGTVITVGKDGVCDVKHEYVDISGLQKNDQNAGK